MCAHFGLTVNRLIRTGYGPYDLEGCDRGALLKVDAKKILSVVENSGIDSGFGDDYDHEEAGDTYDDDFDEQQQVQGEWGVLGVDGDVDNFQSTADEGSTVRAGQEAAAPATIPLGVFRRRGRIPLTSQAFKAVAAAKAAKEKAQLRRRFVK